MRRLIFWNLMTLNGYFEGPQKWSLDWHEDVWGDELEQFSIEQLQTADTILFGRVTYEGMASHWPTAQGEVADIMNNIQKVVFSRTLEKADWNNTRLVRDSPVEEVIRSKQQAGKDMLIFGSANVSSQLMEHGLIDEYRIGIAPVALSGGTALFDNVPMKTKLKLVETKPLSTGCVILTYQPETAKAN